MIIKDKIIKSAIKELKIKFKWIKIRCIYLKFIK